MHREDSKEIKKGGNLAGMLDVFSNVLDIEVAQWGKRNCFFEMDCGQEITQTELWTVNFVNIRVKGRL
jgi:hypothetical protein